MFLSALKTHASKILILIFLSGITQLSAQEYPTGLMLDSSEARNIPRQARLIEDDYRGLPQSYSMEQYAPTAGDQGTFGTCTGFATAYHMRTLMYIKSMREAGYNAVANDHIFSPTFIYEQIKQSGDIQCSKGSTIYSALGVLQNKGAAKLNVQPYTCGLPIRPEAWNESAAFKILSFQTLFLQNEQDANYKILSVKKALSEGNPCLMSFRVAKSFHKVRGALWSESGTDKAEFGTEKFHAMCIIGYDDNKYGGAFRIINSWSTSWGNNGMVWIPYTDFAKYTLAVYTAFAFPIKPKTDPLPTPVIKPVVLPVPELKGNIYFKQNTGEQMETELVNSKTADGKPSEYYKMKQVYTTGTRFRFYMNTTTAAYIYAFATDNTGKVNQIFPFNENISPLLGKNSTVAFPSEDKVIRMDETTGSDYLLILYSKKPLAIKFLSEQLKQGTGSLLSRAKTALQGTLVDPATIKYSSDRIAFELKAYTDADVVPVLIEIPHK